MQGQISRNPQYTAKSRMAIFLKSIPSPYRSVIPTTAGTQFILPYVSADSSIDGIRSDHTDAAIITPDANPSSNFSVFALTLSRIKNTVSAPSVVPANGISNIINISVYIISLLELAYAY